MFCLQCGTKNTAESKFCKECGARVAEKKHAAAPAHSKLAPHIAEDLGASEAVNPQIQRLLDMAFWHNQTGNIPAAILACEAALIIDPESTSALSLLGCLYERQGDSQKAIFAFERVIELNPESEADREKLAALRRGEFLTPVLQPIRFRWLPPALIAALRDNPGAKYGAAVFAALVVVVGLGAAVFHARGPQSAAAANNSSPANDDVSTTILNRRTEPISGASPAPSVRRAPATPQVTVYQGMNNSRATPSSVVPPAGTDRGEASPGAPPSLSRDIPPLAVAGTANPSVPYSTTVKPLEPVSGSAQPMVQVAPPEAIPQHTVVVAGPSDYAGQAPVGSSQVIVPRNQSGDGQQQEDTGPPPPAPSIRIHVHGRKSGAAAPNVLPSAPGDAEVGSAGAAASSQGTALQAKALALQQKGDFHAAALKYSAAIAAFKKEIAAGTSVDEARRGIDTCETGLQICQQSQ